MAFYWSPDVGDFFFPGLTINGSGPFALLCIVLVLLSVVYEAMKVITYRATKSMQQHATINKCVLELFESFKVYLFRAYI